MTELDEEVDQQTLVLRRYNHVKRQVDKNSPHNFHFVFVLSILDEDSKLVKEEIDSVDGKPYNKAMVKEKEALDKNGTCDLVKLPN